MSRAVAAALPASKTATQENFPVATLLLPASKRAIVMAYYHFARHADDVADSAILTSEEKVAGLDALNAGLLGRENSPAVALALTYRETVKGDPDLIDHAAQLLHAFRRDAVRDYCEDWGDLMTYCRYSAAPVGRFLLDLHGESHDTFPPGDALCAALQVLNHLQDCGKDYAELKRVYLPRDWMAAAGMTVKVLEEASSPPALRAVMDRMLFIDFLEASNSPAYFTREKLSDLVDQAEAAGTAVELVDEQHTSQTCRGCAARHQPRGRL